MPIGSSKILPTLPKSNNYQDFLKLLKFGGNLQTYPKENKVQKWIYY